jgi:hypothetical protein
MLSIIYTHTHAHTHIHTYIHTYVHTYIHTYIYGSRGSLMLDAATVLCGLFLVVTDGICSLELKDMCELHELSACNTQGK